MFGMRLFQTDSLVAVKAISNFTSEHYESESFFIDGRSVLGCSTLSKLDGVYKFLAADCSIPSFFICEFANETRKKRKYILYSSYNYFIMFLSAPRVDSGSSKLCKHIFN